MTRDVDRRTVELVRELRLAGWRIRRNGRTNAWMAYPPDPSKEPVSIHSTWSDGRSYLNVLTHLRRAGWKGRP